MIDIKASGNLDVSTKTLTVEAEILPSTELVHEILATLLDEQEKPEVLVDYENVNDVLRVKLRIKTDRDIVKIGQDGLALKKAARDKGLSVVDYVALLNRKTAEIVAQAQGDSADDE